MRVILTATARADLRAIGLWIAEDDLRRAISFVEELQDKALRLGTDHGLYPRVAHGGVHLMNYRGYRFFYSVDASKRLVSVLHIHHGRRSTPDFSA